MIYGSMLTVTVAEFLARRDAAGTSLVAQADAVSEAACAMAQRFRAGGKLLAFGNGNAGTDAAHLAVEFMHPVIVGKPAIPAIALTNDIATVTGIAGKDGFAEIYAHQVRAHARATDVALAVSVKGDCPSITAGLRAASELGLLTVLLTGGEGGGERGGAEHVLRADCTDPAIVKEIHVTIYHLLWELVHVLLEQPAVAR
jgi:D-sedoheptulose 7-phosphate isomerase